MQCTILIFSDMFKIFGLPQTLVVIRKIIISLKSCPLLLVYYGSTFHMKQRWHCCQSCIRRTCGPQNRPLWTDLKQTEATLLLLWSWNSSIMWPQWGQKLFEVAFENLCSTPMIIYWIHIYYHLSYKQGVSFVLFFNIFPLIGEIHPTRLLIC